MASIHDLGAPHASTTLRRTIAVVDMVGYSTIARLLEQNISATSVADLNRQIQTFIDRALSQLPDRNLFCVVARTGDGIIALFERADDAHHFARHVHLFAAEHNDQRTEATAQRWFRVGMATGEVNVTACTGRADEYAGITIANAVRLECSAYPGEIVIDTATFDLLSPASRFLYATEETIRGKRSERFRARRLRVVDRPRSTPLRPSRALSRRTFLAAGLATLGTASLGLWFERAQLENWVHPLPDKRFVALLAWPPPRDAKIKPMLIGLMDVIVSELARAEALDSNLFLTTQGTAADLDTTAQLNEAQTSLGANLILATSVKPAGSQVHIHFQVLESPTSPPLRTRSLTLPANDQESLPRQAVSAAARLLNIDRYQPDPRRLRTGTGSAEAYALFQEAEAFVKQPNDSGLDAAIAKYQQAASADPRYAAAHAKLALALCRLYFVHLDPTALELAHANGRAALQLDPRSVDAHVALATVFSRTGDEKGAFREFAAALSLDPSNPRTLIEQARLYASLNQWDRAEDTFNRLIRVRPNLWLAHLELGVVLSQQGKYKGALTEFRAAGMAKPSEALPCLNVGILLLQQGQLPEAVDNLQHSFDIRPSAEAASTLADAFRVQHKAALALEYALRAVKITPADPANWLQVGDCYSLNPSFAKQAHEAYRRAWSAQKSQLETEPRNGPGWMTLALTALKSGVSSDTRALIAKAEERGAKDLDSQLYKVRILELLGDRDQAISTASLCFGRGAYPFQFVISPDLDALRDDPRYQKLASQPPLAAFGKAPQEQVHA